MALNEQLFNNIGQTFCFTKDVGKAILNSSRNINEVSNFKFVDDHPQDEYNYFQVFTVDGDGHCFLYALISYLQRLPVESLNKIRENVATLKKEMRVEADIDIFNPLAVRNFMINFMDYSKVASELRELSRNDRIDRVAISIDRYNEIMRGAEYFADHEITCVCLIFGINLTVVTRRNNNRFESNDYTQSFNSCSEDHIIRVYVVFNLDNHYDACQLHNGPFIENRKNCFNGSPPCNKCGNLHLEIEGCYICSFESHPLHNEDPDKTFIESENGLKYYQLHQLTALCEKIEHPNGGPVFNHYNVQVILKDCIEKALKLARSIYQCLKFSTLMDDIINLLPSSNSSNSSNSSTSRSPRSLSTRPSVHEGIASLIASEEQYSATKRKVDSMNIPEAPLRNDYRTISSPRNDTFSKKRTEHNDFEDWAIEHIEQIIILLGIPITVHEMEIEKLDITETNILEIPEILQENMENNPGVKRYYISFIVTSIINITVY